MNIELLGLEFSVKYQNIEKEVLSFNIFKLLFLHLLLE